MLGTQVQQSPVGEMTIYDNAIATQIDEGGAPHAIDIFSAGSLEGFTFKSGASGTISAFTDAGAGQVTVTDATHALDGGDYITIVDTTNYTGVYGVTNVTATTFEITATWAGDDGAGNWTRGSSLAAVSGTDGKFDGSHSCSCSSAVSGKSYEWFVYIHNTKRENSAVARKFGATDLGVVANSFILNLSGGDVVWLAVANLTDATDLTFKHTNVMLHKA